MRHPDKHPDFIVRSEKPYNAEPPLWLLGESFTTPAEHFYVRNHGNIPEVDPHSYHLYVSGLVDHPLRLSLEEVREGFPTKTVAATLYCAGNRREGLTKVAPIPGETPWGAGAVGNARWTGVPLREVLRVAGIGDGARHAAFSGMDDAGSASFGGSIPMEKAVSPEEVILAYEMNGEPLPPEHGFPLRVVVPGYIGARSVKWLSEIELRATHSDNPYQAEEYRLFPPNVGAGEAETAGGMRLGELPVNAVICYPEDGETLPAGSVLIRGYAITGGDRRIERVDVSADGGETWVQADKEESAHQGVWHFWEVRLDLLPGRHPLVVRALDSAANIQPEDPRGVWNFKGYVNNSWHRITVRTR